MNMRLRQIEVRQWIAGHSAKPMFALSLAFLLLQAILVVLWIDVPMMAENVLRDVDPNSEQARHLKKSLAMPLVQRDLPSLTLLTMLSILPVVVLESAYHWLSRPWDSETRRYHFFGLLFCLCPSLRMCARSPEFGGRIWLPGLGWRKANKHLRARLERLFSFPMIMIALLILPVLAAEFFMNDLVARHTWLRVSLHVSTGVIWFAFAAEFILMVSVADKKIDYCKKHWIDLAIILLPFLSFLRSMRVLRATRAANLLRVSQISKFARVYRLRGTAIRALRALILLDLFGRLAGGDEGAIRRMQSRLDELDAEAKDLRRRIRRLQRRMKLTHDLDAESENADDSDVTADRGVSTPYNDGIAADDLDSERTSRLSHRVHDRH